MFIAISGLTIADGTLVVAKIGIQPPGSVIIGWHKVLAIKSKDFIPARVTQAVLVSGSFLMMLHYRDIQTLGGTVIMNADTIIIFVLKRETVISFLIDDSPGTVHQNAAVRIVELAIKKVFVDT